MEVLSKNKAKDYKALSLKKERDRQGLFLAEGDKCVKDLLDAFPLEALVCTQDWIAKNNDVVGKYEDLIRLADKRTIEIISSQSSLPSVIGIFKKREEVVEIPELNAGGLYLLLDEIQDPGNLGTIIRTCDWFGVYDIFASRNSVDAYSPKVVQATMGSLSRVKVHYLDLESLVKRNRKIKLIGTLLEGIPLKEAKLTASGMILMGNEGRGISQGLKELIDIPVTIEPFNSFEHPDSLNVAIATAIIISQLR